MDPPPCFRRDRRRENVIHLSNSMLHHLPPPPPPPPLPHNHLQALSRPLLQPRYDAFPSGVSFSQRDRNIIERNQVCDFSQRKPQFDSFFCPKPPQPPISHQENIPFRFVYPNPRLGDDVPIHRFADSVIPNSSRSWGGNLLSGPMEYNTRVSDRFSNSRDSEAEFRSLYNNRSCEIGSRELFSESFEGARRWECGIREAPKLFVERQRSLGYGLDDRIFSRLENRKHCLHSNSNLGRFNSKPRREVNQREFNGNKEMKRVLEKNAFHRVQRDFTPKKHHKRRKISKNRHSISSNGKERIFDHKGKMIELKDKHEEEQSNVALSGSNTEEETNISSMFMKDGNDKHSADSTLIHPSKDLVVPEPYKITEPNCMVSCLGTDGVDEINEHALCNGFTSMENVSVKGPSEIPVLVGGEDVNGLSGPLESRSLENPDSKHLSDSRESRNNSVSENPLFKNIEDSFNFSIRFTNESSKAAQVSIPEMEIFTLPKADEARLLEGNAVATCSTEDYGSESPKFLSKDFEGITSEVDKNYLESEIKKSEEGVNYILNESIDVERSPEAIDNLQTYFCFDHLRESKRKRKISASQMMTSGSNDIVVSNTGSSGNNQLKMILSRDVSSMRAAGCSGRIGHFEVKGISGVLDSSHNGSDFSANNSFEDQKKKRKVVIPGFSPSSHSKFDQVESCPSSDYTIIDQISPKLPEQGSKHGKQAASVDITGGKENFSVFSMDDAFNDGPKLQFNEDSTFFSGTLSVCTHRNYVSDGEFNDDPMTSEFDIPSCMSSPEDLLSHTDFSSSRFSAKPPSGHSRSLFSGKSTENATSDHGQISAKISQPLPPQTGPLPPQTGKTIQQMQGIPLTSKNQPIYSSKVFTRKPAVMFNSGRKFPSSPAVKSRTWHRTGNSPVTVAEPILQSIPPLPSHEKKTKHSWNSYVRQGNSIVRKPSATYVNSAKSPSLDSSVSDLSSNMYNLKKNQSFYSKGDALNISRSEQSNASESLKSFPPHHVEKSLRRTSSLFKKSLPAERSLKNGLPQKIFNASEEVLKSSVTPIHGTGLGSNPQSLCAVGQSNVGKTITYVKRRSNQLVAACDNEDLSKSGPGKLLESSSDKYFKKRKNQLIRVPLKASAKDNGDTMTNVDTHRLKSQTKVSKIFGRHQSGFHKTRRPSKFSLVWKLQDSQMSDKANKNVGPKKFWPYLLPWKRSTYRNSIHTSGKLLLSSSRSAVYTRSTYGYSLRISKVLSAGGSSLKWSKSIDRNSKKANKEATLAVAAAAKRKKEGRSTISTVSKNRENVYRKFVVCVKLHPGERIFRVGSERYKMDPTRRTLHRIIAEEDPSPSSAIQSEKNFKRSYVPKRLHIGNDEYVRIGNGNQLVRDPKKRIRALASEKVRWSLRTARLRLIRKKKYCQFFTRFGKCNKSDGKCPYIHDTSKIAVCTKFLSGSCPDPECKLTHKVIPERMPDCSYYLKGLCSNENCPYRHVNVNPGSSVCKRFLRGYCPDGNECRKKHTYICPAFESKGICPHGSACKLHHPKKMTEKLTNDQKIVRGRYFDGGVVDIDTPDSYMTSGETHSTKACDESLCHEGKYPDYISLAVFDDEEE